MPIGAVTPPTCVCQSNSPYRNDQIHEKRKGEFASHLHIIVHFGTEVHQRNLEFSHGYQVLCVQVVAGVYDTTEQRVWVHSIRIMNVFDKPLIAG